MRATDTNVASEVVKAIPSVTVGGLTFLGVGLSEWVLILTAAYTLLQIFFLLRDRWKASQRKI